MRPSKITLALATAGAGVICLASPAHAADLPPDPVRPSLTIHPCIRIALPGVPVLIIHPCVKVANLDIQPCVRIGDVAPPTDTNG